jgi:hypothetical protein
MRFARTFTPWICVWTIIGMGALSPAVRAASPLSLIRFKKLNETPTNDLNLIEANGPWMIFAASFAGSGAEADARELALELRNNFRLPAYVHSKRYDFSKPVKGLGLTRYGEPKMMRFNMDSSFDEVAVLIGDYRSPDDPRLQKDLQTLKYAQPECLSLEKNKNRETTLRFAGLRAWQRRLVGDDQKRRRGPMGRAFATRNPMLPEDTQDQELDPLLIRMNEKRNYSLLDNPGKYSVRVASFRGQVIIDQREISEIEQGKGSKWSASLDQAAAKAEKMAEILRKKNVEAYVYHDRHESIVTIGSFDSLGTEMPDGHIELQPSIARIMETYGPEKKPILGKDGRRLAGIQPKSFAGYTLDVAPQPILVPRRSVADSFARR